MNKVIVGISPKTKIAEIIATDTPHNRRECEIEGLIIVPTTPEKARGAWGEAIEDIYSICA